MSDDKQQWIDLPKESVGTVPYDLFPYVSAWPITRLYPDGSVYSAMYCSQFYPGRILFGEEAKELGRKLQDLRNEMYEAEQKLRIELAEKVKALLPEHFKEDGRPKQWDDGFSRKPNV